MAASALPALAALRCWSRLYLVGDDDAASSGLCRGSACNQNPVKERAQRGCLRYAHQRGSEWRRGGARLRSRVLCVGRFGLLNKRCVRQRKQFQTPGQGMLVHCDMSQSGNAPGTLAKRRQGRLGWWW